jgi:hypothetical protein
MPEYRVQYGITYQRTNDETAEPDPTPTELEAYIAGSDAIPENPTYLDLDITRSPEYCGGKAFEFTCQSALTPQEIAHLFLYQSLPDGEWGAGPGNGSFVYPTKALSVFDHYAVPDELGVLSFAYVTVNGVKYTV